MGSPFAIGSKESTSSNTTNNTTNNYTDKSANAGGDGSLALAENSSYNSTGNGGISASSGGGALSITTSDPAVVGAALHTVEASNALVAAQYLASLNAMNGANQTNANSQKSTQDAANLAIQSSNSLARQLSETEAAKVSDPSIQIIQSFGKYAAWFGSAVAVAVLAYFVFRKKKHHE